MSLHQLPGFLQVLVRLTDDYEDDALLLRATSVTLTLQLTQGSCEAVAQAEAGVVKSTGERLVARLSMPYRYDLPQNTLSLCGNDFCTPDAIRLTLQRAGGEMLASLSPHEDRCSGLCAGQHAPLRAALCGVLDAAQAECMRCGISVETSHPAPGALKPLYALYYRGMLTAVFDPALDQFDPEKIDGVQLAPLTSSVTGGMVLHPMGTNLANVIGSAWDTPKWTGPVPPLFPITTGTAWRRVWEIVCGVGGAVGSGYFCTCANVNHFCTTGLINNSFVGGHVIAGLVGTVNQRVIKDGTGTAQIIPICKCANNNNNLQLVVQSAAGTNAAQLTNFFV